MRHNLVYIISKPRIFLVIEGPEGEAFGSVVSWEGAAIDATLELTGTSNSLYYKLNYTTTTSSSVLASGVAPSRTLLRIMVFYPAH